MSLEPRHSPGRPATWTAALIAVLATAVGTPAAGQAPVPAPKDVLGYQPGTDSVLADWAEIGNYLSRVAEASPRVRLDTIGQSTLGRPLLLVTLASPGNMRRLASLRAWQARLADPRRLSAAAEDSLVAHAPAVVLINNNIHSTEIGSTQMQLELVWRLAADPGWSRFLDSTIVLLIPSPNPDGVDTVVGWYRRHKGTPFEGGPLPWLYHPYVGHDNNRDWFMLTQVETQAISRVLYQEWFPSVVWDVHQMGTGGARLFVPPFSDPVNPNLDPMLVQGINLVGTAMGTAVLDAGKTGVAHQARFDLWWHGGFRTAPARHNMIGILSEAASARLASPIYVHPDSLGRAPDRGVNYPAPWPGGWWRIGDIVEYELLAAHGLLELVSTQRTNFVRRFVTLGRRQIAAGSREAPRAFVVPAGQRDPGATALLLNLLIATGVDVERADEPFAADGRRYAAGTHVIRLSQPYRAHVKDLLEPQAYPERREYRGGPLIRPYDVTGWSLGMQMGVEVHQADTIGTFRRTLVDSVIPAPGRVNGSGPVWVFSNRTNAESRIIAAALAAGASGWMQPAGSSPGQPAAGSVVLRDVPEEFAGDLATAGVEAHRRPDLDRPANAIAVQGLPRIGLYQSWTASMDEGWTRWVLEQFGIPFARVRDDRIRAGNLNDDIDILIIPDLSERDVREGVSAERIPGRYAGGLGEAGVRHVTEFVRDGGTLVTLDGSSDFAISALNLPVRNVLARERRSDGGSRFSAPGSIFGLVPAPDALPWVSGLPDSVGAFFADSRAFEASDGARVVARYTDPPLWSGFVEGGDQVAGRAAVVAADAGRGRVVLIGFRPQHRGQTHATFKLLFNAVLFGAAR